MSDHDWLSPHPSHRANPNLPFEEDAATCRYCGAWSDADWAKPCPVIDGNIRSVMDAKVAEGARWILP